MKIDYIVWDFNGTILDDVEVGIVSVNKLLRDRGLREIRSREEYQEYFCFPIKHYYEKLGFDFDKEPYEVVAPLWVEQYLNNVGSARMYGDVIDTLELFRSMGIRQVILSATELTMLKGQIRDLGIEEYFDEVMGLDNIHAASKIMLAQDFRARHKDEKMLLIGDTDHDISTARALGAPCVLIARGHQSRSRLSDLGVPLYETLEGLRCDVEKEQEL